MTIQVQTSAVKNAFLVEGVLIQPHLRIKFDYAYSNPAIRRHVRVDSVGRNPRTNAPYMIVADLNAGGQTKQFNIGGISNVEVV